MAYKQGYKSYSSMIRLRYMISSHSRSTSIELVDRRRDTAATYLWQRSINSLHKIKVVFAKSKESHC